MLKKMLFTGLPFWAMALAPADEGAGAGAGDAGGGGDAAAAAAGAGGAGDPSASRWWEGKDYSPEEQQWLTAKGLTEDDPTKIIPKLVKGHRAAEQRIGKGLDSIIDKPGKDQKLAEWMRGNAAALGLPDTEEAYTAAPPDFWPKDTAWDTELEAQARKVAFDNGVPPDVHKAYVNLFATKMKAYNDAASGESAVARSQMMDDLRRDLGDQTEATIAGAKQAAQFFAEKAGLDSDGLSNLSSVLSSKLGDANTIKFLAAIRGAMAEDQGVGLGKGGTLTMTPAEARAALAEMNSPEGDYGKAFARNDHKAMGELKARRIELSKIASAR